MVFGRWKDELYLLISSSVKRSPEEAIKWMSQVEHASSVNQLEGDASPFSAVDAILKHQIHKKLNGLQLVQYKQLQNQYLVEGKVVKGRQLLWILFQRYRVDDASRDLYQSKALREIRIGNNLERFLNSWAEMLGSMVVQPSEAEKYNIFTDEVRKFKPMAKTWEFLDLQMLPNVSYPPTYDDYHKLCWQFLDREACQKARDALLGRSHQGNPAGDKGKPSKPGPGNLQPGAGPPKAPADSKDSKAQRALADKKLAKEKG